MLASIFHTVSDKNMTRGKAGYEASVCRYPQSTKIQWKNKEKNQRQLTRITRAFVGFVYISHTPL